MTDAEISLYMARWLVARKKAQGNEEMSEEDLKAWGETVRELPGWIPADKIPSDFVTIQELWRQM